MGGEGFLDRSQVQDDDHKIPRYLSSCDGNGPYHHPVRRDHHFLLPTITWRRVRCLRSGICPLCAALQHCWAQLPADDRRCVSPHN